MIDIYAGGHALYVIHIIYYNMEAWSHEKIKYFDPFDMTSSVVLIMFDHIILWTYK